MSFSFGKVFFFSYIRANGSMPSRNMMKTRHGARERSLQGSVRLLARCPLVWITLSFVHLKCYKVWTLCHCDMTWLTLTIIPLPASLSPLSSFLSLRSLSLSSPSSSSLSRSTLSLISISPPVSSLSTLSLSSLSLPPSLPLPNSSVCWHNRWLYKEELIFFVNSWQWRSLYTSNHVLWSPPCFLLLLTADKERI